MSLPRLFARLSRVARMVSAACLGLCVVLFMACLAVLAADILLRYTLNAPLQNVSEGVIIAFIYVYMLGGAALYARNEDIALDYFFNKAGRGPQALWLLAVYLAIAATMAVVLVETVKLMMVQRGVLTPALRLPLGIEHAALALAAAVILYCSLVDALGCWIWFKSGTRPTTTEEPK